jgi:hypothetical protein
MREEGVCPPALGPKERGLEIRSDLGSARGRGSDRLPALAGHPGSRSRAGEPHCLRKDMEAKSGFPRPPLTVQLLSL